MNNQTEAKLAKVIELHERIKLLKELYAELDGVILELVADGFKSAELNNLVLTLKDNFADTNTGWTRSAVKRWDVEVITKELAAKRERRAK